MRIADRHEPVEVTAAASCAQPDQGSTLAEVKRAGWDAILLKPPLPPNAIALRRNLREVDPLTADLYGIR